MKDVLLQRLMHSRKSIEAAPLQGAEMLIGTALVCALSRSSTRNEDTCAILPAPGKRIIYAVVSPVVLTLQLFLANELFDCSLIKMPVGLKIFILHGELIMKNLFNFILLVAFLGIGCSENDAKRDPVVSLSSDEEEKLIPLLIEDLSKEHQSLTETEKLFMNRIDEKTTCQKSSELKDQIDYIATFRDLLWVRQQMKEVSDLFQSIKIAQPSSQSLTTKMLSIKQERQARLDGKTRANLEIEASSTLGKKSLFDEYSKLLDEQMSVRIEDFEGVALKLWQPLAQERLGSIKYSISYDVFHLGRSALEVVVKKNATYEFLGGEVPANLQNFSKHAGLEVWIRGQTAILLKLEDSNLQAQDIDRKSTESDQQWTKLFFSFGNANAVDMTKIKNIMLFFYPGDARHTETVIHLDNIRLACQ